MWRGKDERFWCNFASLRPTIIVELDNVNRARSALVVLDVNLLVGVRGILGLKPVRFHDCVESTIWKNNIKRLEHPNLRGETASMRKLMEAATHTTCSIHKQLTMMTSK